MSTDVGQCSLCGGTVTVPTVWLCIIPPVPTCTSCGAVAKSSGPVIPMQPRKPVKVGVSCLMPTS